MYIFNMYHYIYIIIYINNYDTRIIHICIHVGQYYYQTAMVFDILGVHQRYALRIACVGSLICFSWWRVWGATTETYRNFRATDSNCSILRKIFQDTYEILFNRCDCLDDLDRLLKRPRRCVFGCATTLRVIMNYMVLVYFSRVGGPTTSHNPTLIFRR